MMTRLLVPLLIIFAAVGAFSETNIDIKGTVEWDTLQINASISLNLISAGIRLPSGRTSGELLLSSGYLGLIQPCILALQVDSSSTIADLINRGEFSLLEADALALNAVSVPPSLSLDLRKITASYTIGLSSISAALIRHNNPFPIMRTLSPVSAPQYTGVIIIASENLPVHGRKASALAVPCLFPKIWDSNMNLIYERNMLETRNTAMVHYAPLQSLFRNTPSGLTPELTAHVGDRPLRIFANGVYGINPTDLIIDSNDAMLIISSDANRRLLSEGKVAIVLDDSVLRRQFNGD